ncbi:MAG: hypothetical protein AAGL49_00955 [Pseudomonadota bacterium]
MKTRLKRWTSVGLGTAFLGTGLVACGAPDDTVSTDEHAAVQEEAAETPPPSQMDGMAEGEGGEGGEGGEAGHAMETLPVPKRLAFMTGHVEAGLALYRAGEPEMAAPHLLHPVSETHAAERAGLDALGFDASIFEAVSQALEEGRPAEEVEPQLAAAEANLKLLADQAGGEPAEVIQYLMDVIVVEYTIAITDGAVSDPGEYQDAFGFAIVAKDRAAALESGAEDVIAEIDALIALWPEAPIPPADPAPVAQVIAQTSRVTLALPSS